MKQYLIYTLPRLFLFILLFNFPTPNIYFKIIYFIIGWKLFWQMFHNTFKKYAMQDGNYFKMFFGLPGSGKTTTAAKLAKRYLDMELPVYSNIDIIGTYKIDKEDIGVFEMKNGLLLIDEAGLEFNNRDFKKFSKEHLEFFKKHRHYSLDIVYFSQSFDDVDKKLRDLTTELYLTEKFTRYFVLSTPIFKKVGVDELTNDIVFKYELGNILTKRFYNPYKYFSYFNSKVPKQLQVKSFPITERI